MSRVLAAIGRHAESRPDHIALAGSDHSLTYSMLAVEVQDVADILRQRDVHVAGIFMDNRPAWAVSDLACLQAQIPVVPMPLFFTPLQTAHLLTDAGVDTIITDQPDIVRALLSGAGTVVLQEIQVNIAGQPVDLFRLSVGAQSNIPAGVAKVTYTSGTTGDPKGVCLTGKSMERVAASLQVASEADSGERHLSLLPLATLLENIGGIYVPMLAGATALLPGLAAVGMRGAAQLDARQLTAALATYSASSCIMIPQMLQACVMCLEAGMPRPSAMRYMAVGGAPVSRHILERAATMGLPVFEGYGLSEAASVTAVNTVSAHRAGTVGKPLPHVRMKFAADGEIMVSGSLFSGYLGDDTAGPGAEDFLPTGDIGHLDDDGFLHITGRKKHIFITAFGRNVSPEWVESELTVEGTIVQAVVFGEARPFNVAVLVPRPGVDAGQVKVAVERANSGLPDYAQLHSWLLADEPFTVGNRQLTGTGRPRRNMIEQVYGKRMAKIYAQEA